jgi:SAM-dependent methyltransferase
MTVEQSQRIAALQDRYQVKFEQELGAATSTLNYEYLDILDRAWPESPRATGGVVCDIGCASFWYAAALAAFFRPAELVGIDVEGHRLFKDGRTRIDYATGYVSGIPHARFLVADYLDCDLPADVITAWFPFLTPAAILAWRLPLSLLAPERFFAQVSGNLRPGGYFLMVNHGAEEAALGEKLCMAAGLRRLARVVDAGPLSGHRPRPAIATCWNGHGHGIN